MAIQATFTADFTKFDAALKNAQGTLKTFEVSTKNVAQSLQRMTAGFDGTKIMREAKLTETAVRSIGGAAKLTEQEQRKVNATVTEAIAKYKALGQTAPKELLALADATKKVVAPTTDAVSAVDSLVKKYLTIGAALAVAKQAFGALTDFVTSSIASFAGAEAAQNRMVAALRAQGTATPDVIRQYTSLASTIQRTTAFSDDAANEMEALFVQIGDVGPAQMGKATTAATDLAAGLGVDLRTATLLVAKAMEGNTGALSRYGIKIDEAKIAAQGADAVFSAIQDRFGGQAQAQLDTYAGKLSQLANNWDNVKEAVGKFVIANEITTLAMRKTSEALASASDKSETASISLAKFWLAATGSTTGALAIAQLERMAEGLNAVAAGARMVAQVKSPFAEWAKDTALPNITGGIEEFERQNKALDEAKKRAEEAAKAIRNLRDELSGAKAGRDLAQLSKAWQGLTDEQKKNAAIIDALVSKYMALVPALREVPPELRATVQEMNRIAIAAGAMNESVTDGIRSLDGIGTQLKSIDGPMGDVVMDMIEFESHVGSANDIIGKFGYNLSKPDFKEFGKKLSGVALDIRRDFSGMVESVSQAFAQMIVSANGFKDGFLGVWQAIKNGIMNILTSILNYFLNTFIKGLLGAITGQSGAFSNAFSGMFSGAGKGILGSLLGGGGAALAGGAAIPGGMIVGPGGVLMATGSAGVGGAAAGGGLLAGTSGALLGGGAAAGGGLLLGMLGKKLFGGAGIKAGAFGAASGAATGALIGSVVPILGTAIGALVGGVAGLLSGLFGKKESQKVNDARDQMLTQMAAAFGGTGKGGTGAGSDFAILAEQLQKATGSGELFNKFLKASTMKDFEAVTKQVAAALDAYKAKTDAAAAAQQRLAATTEEAKKKLAELEGQMQSLNEEEAALNRSEAPEAHMGVVEKRQRERIAAQKAAIQAQIDAAKVAAKAAEDAQKGLDELIGKFLRLGDVALDEAERARLALLGIGKNIPPITIPYRYQQQGAGLPTTGTAPYSGEAPEANIGFEERRRMLRGYAQGGPVYAAAGGWLSRGTDTVPAMLTPGEYVLSREDVAAIRAGRGASTVNVYLTISAFDGADVDRVVRSASFRRAITAAVARNEGGYRTDLRTAIGVR